MNKNEKIRRIRYRATRRSTAEIERFLARLIDAALAAGLDPEQLETVVAIEDPIWQTFILKGAIPPAVPTELHDFLNQFRLQWNARTKHENIEDR